MNLKRSLKKIPQKLKSTFYRYYYVVAPKRKVDLLIYDTIFPNPISGFRLSEFCTLLEYYKKSIIITNPTDYVHLSQSAAEHEKDLELLKKNNKTVYNKTLAGKAFLLNKFSPKLFYCIFLSIIDECLPILERNKINFVFTLYPGGGFGVEDEVALEKLKRVLASPYFKAVFVTQRFTKDFLVEKFNCPEEKIHHIFGCVVPQYSLNVQRIRRFQQEKDKLNICFCAAKYIPKGLDKGYDIFVDVAKKLIDKGRKVKFTVIGGFNAEDINIGGYQEYFDFLGYKRYDELDEIFLNQDIILSPNRPFLPMKGKGVFDGFPLGTVIEAGLNGVVPIATDELKQNDFFDSNEIIITKPDAEEIILRIEELIADEQRLYEMSRNAQKKFREIYCDDFQMTQRINILNRYIK